MSSLKEEKIRPAAHVVVSLAISSGVFYVFNSWAAAVASFIAGVFVDLDHVLDYFLSHGINLNVKKFFAACEENDFKKLFLFLHSFELLAVLWVLIYVMKLDIVWIAIAVGFTHHLLLDQFFNSKNNRLRYFFLYRTKYGFDRKAVVKNEKAL